MVTSEFRRLIALIGVAVCATMLQADETASGTRVAILHEPGMPVQGCLSDHRVLKKILERDCSEVTILSVEQMADPAQFSADAFDVLIVPTGETFPAVAHDSLVQFLRTGGNMNRLLLD